VTKHATLRKISVIAGLVLVAAVASQWQAVDRLVYEARLHWQVEQMERGRGEKVPSGRSFQAQTRVDTTVIASAAAPGFDSERVWSGYDDWEPTVATRPNSSEVWQATTRYNGPKACNGCPFPVIVLRKSTDGGVTWGADRFAPITKNKQNDPEIQISTNGTIYLAWIDGYVPGIRFSKSTNGGSSWSTPLTLTPRGAVPAWSDKPLLVISPNGKDVYIGFNASDAYVIASHDYGATWGKAVKTNNDTRYWFHTGGAVAPNGNVYFVTSDFSQDYLGDAYISIVKSVNGGTSWTTTRIDTSREMPDCPWAAGCYKGFFGTIAGLAVDSGGKLLAAYNVNNSPNAPMQLYARTSSDGGTTWSSRIDVSGAGVTINHHSVQVAAYGNNTFAVVWQDDRNGINAYFNAFLRKTTNGGNTWGDVLRLSDASSGAPYKSSAGHNFPYGDYLGVSFDSAGAVHAIWGEGISFTGPGGTWYAKGT
jgi:hypothetical protein